MGKTDLKDLLTVDEAIAIIDGTAVSPRVIEVPLEEARGLVLAQEIVCDRDYPPFDKSLMDGYAVRRADVAGGSAKLRMVGEIAAGDVPERGIGPGETMAIMTGAAVPGGADGVVPVEDVEEGSGGRVQGSGFRVQDSQKWIQVLRAEDPARFVSRAGSDAKAGQVVLRVGTRLESAQLAAGAMVGAGRVRVFDAPRVAVLATGDEIVPYDQRPGATKIRNSNSIMLCTLLRGMGCRVTDLGMVEDRPEVIRGKLEEGMGYDVLMVTGGMSMGRYDYVPQILRELGVEMKITKLRIKPGKPFVFGTARRAEGTCCVFGLPGNPVSGFVCTVRLASRLFTRLAGGRVEEKWLVGRLAKALPPNGSREFYQPVELEYSAGGLVVRPLEWKGSADLFTLARAKGLLRRDESEPAVVEGTTVRVMEI